jgi:hypothetical protein
MSSFIIFVDCVILPSSYSISRKNKKEKKFFFQLCLKILFCPFSTRSNFFSSSFLCVRCSWWLFFSRKWKIYVNFSSFALAVWRRKKIELRVWLRNVLVIGGGEASFWGCLETDWVSLGDLLKLFEFFAYSNFISISFSYGQSIKMLRIDWYLSFCKNQS